MTAPHSAPDLVLASRAIMKTRLTPAFANAVDRGELDGFGLYRWAEEQALKKRADAQDTEGGEE
jgi:hypothetical protein